MLRARSTGDVGSTAEAGERLEPGTVFIAPTDYHMEVTPSHRISLHQEPPEVNQRPAGNVLLRSIARIYGGRAVGVVLTGMGEDGARGLERLARVGARTIAQDEETSIVFGMPKVAIERGAAQEVLPSSVIAEAITRLVVELQKQSPGDAGS